MWQPRVLLAELGGPEKTRAALDKMREKLMTEAKTKYEQLARENKAKSDKFLA